VFALNNTLASNKALPRWDPRARLGLNLEPSPTHARNVHLVLSLTTGLVSPQFHVHFDDFFETCKYGVTDGGLASTWQCLAGFKRGSSNDPVLHTSDSLLSQSPILHPSVHAIPHDSMEHDTFSFPEVSDADSITSQFYEDGSVTFSDTTPPVTRQASQVTPPASTVTSHVTRLASQPPVQPLAQQNCNRTPRNTPRAFPRVSPTNFSALTHIGIRSRSQNCTMSCTMAEPNDQRNFYGPTGMYYMSACTTIGCINNRQTVEDLLHDENLAL
jgi:hypothetical protein